jgi:hypothetical protein
VRVPRPLLAFDWWSDIPGLYGNLLFAGFIGMFTGAIMFVWKSLVEWGSWS